MIDLHHYFAPIFQYQKFLNHLFILKHPALFAIIIY
jgi:hypothetical protein